MSGTKKSRKWMENHLKDEYVQRSQRDGYRSRASYKLLEIDDKYNLLRPGQVVIDLGAAPGGWTQVAADRVKADEDKGTVIALDILPMDYVAGVDIIEGDFTADEVLAQLMDTLAGRPVDLVISDMAPNLSGVKDIDQPRSMYLVELAVALAEEVLRPGGALLAKCFEGEGIEDLRKQYRQSFKQVNNVKPKASRSHSREIYLLGRGAKRG